MAGRRERMVGPQAHALVAGAARELEACVDQPATEVVAAPVGMYEQDPELRRSVTLGVGDAEDAADASSVELGDPGGLATRVVTARVVGDDLGHERLEALVPTELVRVHLAVGHHDPAEIARPSEWTDGY